MPQPCTPVTITIQPQSQTAAVGETKTFTVVAAGTAPFTYQWKKNGVNIAGATSSSYTTPILTLADSGSTYSCYVTNCSGSNNVTSSNATLLVSCRPITVTQCPPTYPSCDSCKEIIRSFCIKYYGEDLDDLEITQGDTLNEILEKIQDAINAGITTQNLFTADLTLEENRQHEVDEYSFTIAKGDKYKFIINEDAEFADPPDTLTTMGFLYRNEDEDIYAFNGMMMESNFGYEGYPYSFIRSLSGSILESLIINNPAPSVFLPTKIINVVDDVNNKEYLFQLSTDGSLRFFDQDFSEMMWALQSNGVFFHNGAYANTAIQKHTTGGDVTIGNNIKTFIYKVSVTVGAATITLPSGEDGKEIEIVGLSADISGLAISSVSFSQTVLGAPTTLENGKPIRLKYIDSESSWIVI